MLGFTFENLDIKNLTQDQFIAIRKAVPLHGVVVIKNQNLCEEDLIAFTHKFGTPVLLPEALRFNNTKREHPELARVSNILPDGTLLKDHTAAEYWHSDGDFWQPGQNYIFNVLYSLIVPKVGGDTGFVDLELAYNSLSEDLKKKIENLEITVSCDEIPDFKDIKPEDRQPDALHRIKHEHIETKKIGLYLGHLFAKLNDLAPAESDTIMGQLTQAIENPANQYVHKWSVGDVLIWDNTAVMHRGMGGYQNFKRLLFRTQAFIEPMK
ncbi:MAG: Putative taurine catabolism dioxygenase [uncultured Aureispira sp.]|uniref:Taurine catabolism dioxygenase n=1 Tax=uncultured Aureispira sp. TaxID=1331704 RepID=A0A6S6U8Q1_9BACT|nr:MAG: Putative taurine catabolism dioxygenase [uncultured Aureispira sp.]